MNGEARRDEIVRMLTESSSPLAGVTLAKHFEPSGDCAGYCVTEGKRF